MVIQRDRYLKKLIDRQGNGLIKVVTGPRRCGKSFLLFHLFKQYLLQEGVEEDHIIEAAFDDEAYESLLDRHVLADYLRSRMTDEGHYYILLDEIQEVDGFERVLNGLLRKENADVYVTGSNSTLLSSEITTLFRDRGDEIRLHPLSFSEFMSVYDGSLSAGWDEYLVYGGLPLVLSYQDPADKAQYLERLFQRTYLSDIIDRRKVRNRDELDELVNILASAVGVLTNPAKLERTFSSEKHVDFNHQTINKYIGYLKDAFIINEAQRYDVKGKRYINTTSKYYFEDTGLRNARLNFRQIEETHLMENIIYNELQTRGYRADVGVVSKYGKEDGKTVKRTLEVDFVANKASERVYIQSAFAMNTPEKEQQEKRPLQQISDSFRKIIVVKDDIKARHDEAGTTIIGLWQFLLDEDSLKL